MREWLSVAEGVVGRRRGRTHELRAVAPVRAEVWGGGCGSVGVRRRRRRRGTLGGPRGEGRRRGPGGGVGQPLYWTRAPRWRSTAGGHTRVIVLRSLVAGAEVVLLFSVLFLFALCLFFFFFVLG